MVRKTKNRRFFAGAQNDNGEKRLPRSSKLARNDKHYFEPVDTKVNFPEMEKKILDEWYKKGIVKKYLNKNKNSRKYFSFLDGPITANNPMGVHHAWGRTYKDLWQRFKNMQGFKQRFQNGFDCQGLWVEVEVEKELGLKNKKDIENLVPGDRKKSVAKFVDLCKKRVYKYADIQTQQSKRLGYIVDWDHSYFTLSDDNNYMIWYFLKTCHEHGWIYKGNDAVPWCPRCETAISQHEILTENYKEVTHKSIYLKLKVEGKKNEYLVIWTTTPWTIPANTAVAVDQELDYSLVTKGKEKYWVAKEAAVKVFGKDVKVEKTVKGDKLVGLKYESPYDYLDYIKAIKPKHSDCFHTVVATDRLIMPISTEEGTGLVHTSTSTGQEDYKLGRKIGLPVHPAIDDKANYLAGYSDLVGKNAKEIPELILDYLEKEGWVLKIEKYKHRYPTCWRCKEELVWKVTDEWYIAMDKLSKNPKTQKLKNSKTLRERLIKVARKINWIPEFGLKRELDWLKNMDDWLISKKNRYWGLALPIWECDKCGHFEVIGSKKELKEKAVKGWKQFEGKSPHKPQIDEIKIKCPKCKREIERIEPVGNPWLDAGIVTFSTISKDNKAASKDNLSDGIPLYFGNKKEWRNWAPADFITESFPGQFKNWFYSLIVMSTVLENIEPVKTIFGYATLFAEDGRAMHKSWGNMIDFNDGAEKIGVDVMRWMYVRQNPADNLLFGYKVADEVRRRFHLKLWNVYNFFITYANLDNWSPTWRGLRPGGKPTTHYSPLTTHQLNLDQWILGRLNKVVGQTTDCLEKYDAYTASRVIEEFVDDLSNWYIRRSRERVGFVAESEKDKNAFYETSYFVLVTLSKLLAPLVPFISEVVYKNLTREESVHLSEWPLQDSRFKIQDSRLIKNMKLVRDICELGHAERKEKKIPVRQPLLSIKVVSQDAKPTDDLLQLIKAELNIKNVEWTKGNELKITLDTKITSDLEEEARTRELIRKIQNERRKLGFSLKQKAGVTSQWLPKKPNLIEKVKKITLATKLQKGKFKVEKTL